MIFGKFMVSDTSLRYNLGLDNFVLMETGPVCISSREKGGQLHVCTYYVLVDKKLKCRALVEIQFHTELLWRTTCKFGRREQTWWCKIDWSTGKWETQTCAFTFTSTLEISCTCKTGCMPASAARRLKTSFLESLESQQELGQLGHLDCTNIAVR